MNNPIIDPSTLTEEQKEAISKKLAELPKVSYEEMQQRLKEAFTPPQPEATIRGWIARDSKRASNSLHFHRNEVARGKFYWENKSPDRPIGESLILPEDMFPTLTWQDEPIEVEITIKPKKQ